MPTTWDDLEALAGRTGQLGALALRAGASTAALDDLERHLGVTLPPSLRAFLAAHDGQERAGRGLFFGSEFLGVEGIRAQWDTWRGIDEDAMNADCADDMGSQPAGVVRPLYTNRGWIPLTHDFGGNHVGLDFDPDVAGHPGQVITFGRDVEVKRLVAPDFDAFLDRFADQWRSGPFTLAAAGWDAPAGTRAWP